MRINRKEIERRKAAEAKAQDALLKTGLFSKVRGPRGMVPVEAALLLKIGDICYFKARTNLATLVVARNRKGVLGRMISQQEIVGATKYQRVIGRELLCAGTMDTTKVVALILEFVNGHIAARKYVEETKRAQRNARRRQARAKVRRAQKKAAAGTRAKSGTGKRAKAATGGRKR